MATLAELIDRVEAQLMDTANVIFDTGTITEGIRSALAEYNTASETTAKTISGLDGAGSTTLSAVHETMIVTGAAGYTAVSRAVDRAESFTLGSEAEDLMNWGEARLREFRAMVGFVFPGYLVVLAGSRAASDAALVGSQASKLAAEIALLTAQEQKIDAETALAGAQAAKLAAETARITAQETRDAASWAKVLAGESADETRKTSLRESTNPPWRRWKEDGE